MSDWSLPTLTTAYATFLSSLTARLNDLAVGNEAALVTLTNQPTNTIRWNASSAKWQIWSGTAWGDLAATYAISISGNAATATTASAVPWSGITSKPTTLSGFGITDGITAATAAATYAPIASPHFTGTAQANDDAGSAQTIGWRDVPQVGGAAKTASYTLVLADRGKGVDMNGTSLTLTIPANSSVAFPVGTTIAVTNLNASALSIAITTDTLTLANSTTSGTRTLAQNGMATLRKVGTTSWLAGGAGLT